MSKAFDPGITVTEIASMDQPISISTESTAAFIGRALRGPLNIPILVRSIAQFKRFFGGEWNQSYLGAAVRQFFEHGGTTLYVVRVANNATGAIIELPAANGKLTLSAIEYGSEEKLRASVDYDGIAAEDSDIFNLTIQRLDSETGLVIDQEIHYRLSCQVEHDNFIGDALLTSSLARLGTNALAVRPDVTIGPGVSFQATYVGVARRGGNGNELTDYDVIGSAASETGMFALNGIENINLLYMPPRLNGDYGPTALLAAELYCRKRRAMLITDPPSAMESTEQLIEHYAQSGSASANVLTYFPRVSIKGCQHPRFMAAGAAIAGLLCKLDKEQGPWAEFSGTAAELQRGLQPLTELDEDEQQTLIRAGVNVLSAHRGRRCRIQGAVTFGAGGHIDKAATNLSVRRTCLMILKNIERGTRWVVFEPNDHHTLERVRSQVHAYLTGLADSGALADDDVFVRCDPNTQDEDSPTERGVKILVSFVPRGWPQPLSFTIHQSMPGVRTATTAFAPARVRPVLRAG